MSEQHSSFRSNSKAWVVGGGAVLALAVVVYVGTGYPPNELAASGTIAPAERYRAAQVTADEVQLGDQAVAQLMQTDLFERMVSDPEFRAMAADPGFQALAQHPQALAAMAQYPQAFAALAQHPQAFAAFANHPQAFAAFATNPQAFAAMAQNPPAYA